MIKIRRAAVKDVKEMVKTLLDAGNDNYSAAGEYYARQELVDPNYEAPATPHYSRDIFLKENAKGIRRRLGGKFKAFVMFDGDKMIGYAISEKHLGRFWINDIVLKRKYQSRGLGKKLFSHVTRGQKQIYLWVNTKNPATKFWRKQGFREITRESLMVKGK